jgi:hypothetical protein
MTTSQAKSPSAPEAIEDQLESGGPYGTLSLFTGMDSQASMLLGFDGGAHALLNCTSSATSPSRASIIGTEARIDIDPGFHARSGFTVVPRSGAPTRFGRSGRGRGLHYEADEVARCLRAGILESPAMPLAESVSVMETMEAVLAGPLGG